MKKKYIIPNTEAVCVLPNEMLAESGPGGGKPAPDGPSKGRNDEVVIDVIEEDNEVAFALWAMENEESF